MAWARLPAMDARKVLHIMNEKEATEHPFTKPARVIDKKLSYRTDEKPASQIRLTIKN